MSNSEWFIILLYVVSAILLIGAASYFHTISTSHYYSDAYSRRKHLFGLIVVSRYGDVVVARMLGKVVYDRVGVVRSLFGFTWGVTK